ncbi:hypothetical protein [Rhodopirellula sp. SWK7]|uniref:hypothetical protein n=1 Tax=Rhodopirellula sp. SWK7 TaxID=595460 RepID=UPI0002BD2D57|nr:hypothetical protein [Rhodopirellula sp. SWK7]EMI40285.1 putative secreted protein [Rhodopirellula sp. SWK7]
MRIVLLLTCVAVFSSPLRGDDVSSSPPDFSSKSAEVAIQAYSDRLAFLDQKLAEQITAAKDQLREDLSEAAEVAVSAKDFAEVSRISGYIESPQFGVISQLSAREEKSSSRWKVENSKLRAELNLLKVSDPITGFWDYNNGNVLEYLTNGSVLQNGRTVAVWRRLEGTSTYLCAYVDKLYADRLQMMPDGRSIVLTGPTGKKMRLDRKGK